MSSLVNNGNFQTVECTEHPFMTPLVKFHGHIIKTFSPFPSEGKFLEVVKRIALVVMSPLAYLALAFIGILGYPYTVRYTVRGTKQVPIQNSGNTSSTGLNRTFTTGDRSSSIVKDAKQVPIQNSGNTSSTGLNRTFTTDSRSSSIVKDAKQEMLQTVGAILSKHNVLKIKYIINCKIAGQKHNFEIDIFSEEGFINSSCFKDSVDGPLKEVKKWFIEKFKIHGLKDKIDISGQAFCLAEDNIHHASWLATDSSTKDSIRFNTSNSETTPDKEDLIEYLKLCFNELNIQLPENLKSPADLFEKKLLANQRGSIDPHK